MKALLLIIVLIAPTKQYEFYNEMTDTTGYVAYTPKTLWVKFHGNPKVETFDLIFEEIIHRKLRLYIRNSRAQGVISIDRMYITFDLLVNKEIPYYEKFNITRTNEQ